MARGLSLGWGIVFSTLFVGVILGVLAYFDAQSHVLDLLSWIDGLGAWGPVLFILCDLLVVVFVLPGVVLTLGAGFLFGIARGTLYVVIATSTGAAIAFLIARHLFGERTARFVLRNPKLKLLDDEFAHDGWKFVMLTRFIPFFPFKLSNYFFGLTQFSLRDFFFGTLVGIVPITFTNVYLGSLAGDLATLGSPAASRSSLQWGVYGVGFLITIAAVFYVNYRARRALEKYVPSEPRKK